VLQGLLLVYVLEELVGKVHQTGWQWPFTSSQPYQIGEGDAGEALDILISLRAGTNNIDNKINDFFIAFHVSGR